MTKTSFQLRPHWCACLYFPTHVNRDISVKKIGVSTNISKRTFPLDKANKWRLTCQTQPPIIFSKHSTQLIAMQYTRWSIKYQHTGQNYGVSESLLQQSHQQLDYSHHFAGVKHSACSPIAMSPSNRVLTGQLATRSLFLLILSREYFHNFN